VAGAAKDRVLLVPFSGLGDLVMHLPLVTVLKEEFEVDIVIDRAYDSFGGFLKAQGILSEYLSCNQSKTLRGVLAKIVFFLARIDPRSYRYILVYDRPLFTFLSCLLPSRKVIRYGFIRKTLRGPMGWSPYGRPANQTAAVMDFARYLSYPAVERSYTFSQPIMDACRGRARRMLDRFGIDSRSGSLVAIGPFANHLYKQAPFSLFQKVARHAMDLGLSVAMIGSSADKRRAEAFRQELDLPHRANFLDLVGQLQWEETIGLLGLSAAFVSNDSGIMHVGLACGTSTVAFFGPTDPYSLIPRTTQHLHPVFLGIPCQPCWQKGPTGRFRCPEVRKACLQQIDPEDVIRLVSSLVTGLQPSHRIISPTVRHP